MDEIRDRLIAIKIPLSGGGYSDAILISPQAEYVIWDETQEGYISLKDVLGNVELNKGTIQAQLNSKASTGAIQSYIDAHLQQTTENYLDENLTNSVLRKTYLKNGDTLKTGFYSGVTEAPAKQYAVEFDADEKLSVNVPWTDTVFSPTNNIWTGVCENISPNDAQKIIQLDKQDLSDFTESEGTIIAIYFQYGNVNKLSKLKIDNIDQDFKPIYYFSHFNERNEEQIAVIDENTPQPWYKFNSGLKFFTYYTNVNEPGWLLMNPDYSLVQYLMNNKSNINSPVFTGIPQAPTAATNTNTTQIATTAFVNNAALLQSNLKTNEQSELTSLEPSQTENRQYPVVKDSNGKLSVNVPWVSSNAQSAVQKIWTGVCNSSSAQGEKTIVLDLDSSRVATDFNLVNGTTIIVYFKNGNTSTEPKIKIQNNSSLPLSICYQQDVNTLTPINNDTLEILRKWGPGLKIFTYRGGLEVVGNSYWIMQTIDFLPVYNFITSVNQRMSQKANLDSPAFTNIPTAPTAQVGTQTTQIATTAFVNNTVNVLKEYVDNLIDNMGAIKSHIGMIIHSTRLSTEQQVIDYYGGIEWKQHTGYVLVGASNENPASFNQQQKDGGEVQHNHGGVTSDTTLTAAQSGVGSHTHTWDSQNYPKLNYQAAFLTNSGGAHVHSNKAAMTGAQGSNKVIVDSTGTRTLAATVQAGAHQHTIPQHTHSFSNYGKLLAVSANATQGHHHDISSVSNLPPYKFVYIWQRVQ